MNKKIYAPNLFAFTSIDFCLSLLIFFYFLAFLYFIRKTHRLTRDLYFNLRPYNGENTGSRPISAVKPHLARSVLWWGTTWEYRVL